MLVFGLGAILLFTEVRALYVPGFFLLAGADAAVQAVRTAYVGELFPTELRATLGAFVGAVNVAAGSFGLALVGVLAGVIDPSTSVIAMAVACTATVIVIRRLPETVGIDVIEGTRACPSAELCVPG